MATHVLGLLWPGDDTMALGGTPQPLWHDGRCVLRWLERERCGGKVPLVRVLGVQAFELTGWRNKSSLLSEISSPIFSLV